MSGSTVETHRDLLKNYHTSKGTIRFHPEKPLPTTLIRKLAKPDNADLNRVVLRHHLIVRDSSRKKTTEFNRS